MQPDTAQIYSLQFMTSPFYLPRQKQKEQIWMNAFTGLHANTQKNHLNENLYRFIRLHTKRNTSEWKTLKAHMSTQNKTNKIWITGLQVFMPKQKRNNFEQKPLQAYMLMLKVKKNGKNLNESLYRLTCLDGKQIKLMQGV